jgi:response regulator RpfG family c-di-GMP phosphodiesterase
MPEKILCVDDDANILDSYRRQLRKQFHIETAQGPERGLAALKASGPFAVVLSDMRMPGMNGIQFLAQVRVLAPDAVRVMLTGYADVDTAIAAVNEGNLFRFLSKPCPPEVLSTALEACVRQYRLVLSERELLEKTLGGSVKVLTEILGLVNPAAFSRASRIRRSVQQMVRALELPNGWQFELAAMLSQIGCLTLPHEILEKIEAGQPLSWEEQEMFASHPSIGRNLLANIPRLELISRMIETQQAHYLPASGEPQQQDQAQLGGQMLRVALDLDRLLMQGRSPRAAIGELHKRRGEYDPRLLAALDQSDDGRTFSTVRSITVRELAVGMILGESIHAKSGLLLVARGQEVTQPVLERLRSFSMKIGIVEPFVVLVSEPASLRPSYEAKEGDRVYGTKSLVGG